MVRTLSSLAVLAAAAVVAGAAPAHADVIVPLDPNGAALVATPSGNTRCEVHSDFVTCAVAFVNPPAAASGPANAVTLSVTGDISYLQGDWGGRPATTMDYGTTYAANGWTISPSPSGTRFTKWVSTFDVSTAGVTGTKQSS